MPTPAASCTPQVRLCLPFLDLIVHVRHPCQGPVCHEHVLQPTMCPGSLLALCRCVLLHLHCLADRRSSHQHECMALLLAVQGCAKGAAFSGHSGLPGQLWMQARFQNFMPASR